MSYWKKASLFILGLMVTFSFACNKNASAKTFMWEIILPNGVNSYLLGSVHMMKKSHYPLNPIIEAAFTKSEVLVVEVDLTGEKIAAVAMKMMAEATYKGDETIKDNLSAESLKLVEKKLSQMGTSLDAFKKSKPWILAMNILQSELGKLGFYPQYGIDMHFLNKAAESKKKVEELEGAEFQLNLFMNMTKKEQEQFLLSTIKDADHFHSEFKKIVDAWLSGNAEDIQSLMVEYKKKDPASSSMMKKLLDDRNVGMAEKIIKLLSGKKPVFVVVGAAHMVGPQGIVQLLRDKGYKVEQR